MSTMGDIMTAVLAEVVTAIPGTTTLQGVVPSAKIPTSKLPHAQANEPVINVTETLPWRQNKLAYSFFLTVTDIDKTQEEMLDYFDAFKTQINTNPRLGTTVHWVNIPSFVLVENVDERGSRKAFSFEVVVELFA